MSDALARDLSARFGAHAVSDDAADKSAYAHDLWPRQLLSTRGGLSRPPGPLAVFWPERPEHLSELVEWCRGRDLHLVPFGAGSGVVGGVVNGHDSIAVDLKRLRSIHDVDVARGYVDVDAGILGEHLEERLRRRGATLGHFPSSIYCSTVGGWVATRSAGQCSGRYGKIEDMVLSVDGVLGTGEPFSAGPPVDGAVDARPLLVGSEGIFGFITRTRLRVWPAPTEHKGCAFSFATMPEAWDAIRAMYQSGLRPAVTRLYDPVDTYIFLQGGRSKPAHAPANPRRPPAAVEFLLRRALDHPKAINALASLVEERVYTRSLLLVIFEGTADDPHDEALLRARAICASAGARDEGEAAWRRWLTRRHSVSYRQPPTYERGVWVDTMEVAAPWSRLDALYHGVREALSKGGVVMAHMSHAYPDGCSIYFTFAGASPDDAKARETYDATWTAALRAAHEAGGTIAHHHGIGRSKRQAMTLEWGAGLQWITALQRAADPDGVLHRGPLVPERGERATPPTVPAEPSVDAASQLVTTPLGATLASVSLALAPHGLSVDHRGLDRHATVGDLLRAMSRDGALHTSDPVDHVIAGWRATLPDGSPAWWLPAPRRSAGPDPFALVLGDARFGAMDAVTLRARSSRAEGPARVHAATPPDARRDAALDAWVERAASEMRET